MKDTLRILVDWKCNLKCDYCCNEQQRFRDKIVPLPIGQVVALMLHSSYKTICISGGEPLLFLDRVLRLARTALSDQTVVLYTNGIYLNASVAGLLAAVGVDAINVGLHIPQTFDRIIRGVRNACADLPMSVRFHAEDRYRDQVLEDVYPGLQFRYWHRDDCERDNEDHVVVSDWTDGRAQPEPTVTQIEGLK